MTTKTKSEQAQVAAIIRKHLKVNFPQYTFKVKSASASMTTSVCVNCENLNPTHRKQIEEFVNMFQYGRFDGMTDSYDMNNCNDGMPQVKYANMNCQYTQDLHTAINEKVIDIATNAHTLSDWDKQSIRYNYLHDANNWDGTTLKIMKEV